MPFSTWTSKFNMHFLGLELGLRNSAMEKDEDAGFTYNVDGLRRHRQGKLISYWVTQDLNLLCRVARFPALKDEAGGPSQV